MRGPLGRPPSIIIALVSPEASTRSDDVTVTYPSLFRRYLSSLIDGLLLIAGMVFGADILALIGPPPTAARVGWFLFLILGYEPLLTANAMTLGQYITGIRVRRLSDPSRRVNLVAAYARYLIKLPLGFLSFLTIGFNERRRAIHDFVAKSIVIDAARPVTVTSGAPTTV